MDIGSGLSALIPPKNQKTSDGETTSRINPEVNLPKKEPSQGERARFESREAGRESESEHERVPSAGTGRRVPFQDVPTEEREFIFHIETDRIKPNPYQPRREYKENELQELAQSIREFGIIQPLIVSRVEREMEHGTDVSYQLIAGERRLRAAKLVGLKQVPVLVKQEPTNGDKLLLALIENLERSDLNPIESARGYARLQDEFQLTQREIAVKVGKSRSSIANALRLLTLPSHMQRALETGKLTESQGRLLLQETNPHLQEQLFQKLLTGTAPNPGAPRGRNAAKANVVREPFWEKQIERYVGAPVSVERVGEKGKVVITFFSEEEWGELRKKLTEAGDEEPVPSV